MRLTSAVLLFPSLALAADQVPLADKVKGWFQQAQSYIPTNAPNVPDPVEIGAQKAADAIVYNMTLDNWQDVLSQDVQSQPGEPVEWMIYITGGNRTCHGLCAKADAAWKEAAPILAARPSGPKLAEIDCETNQIFCNTWAVGPPYVYVFFIPHPLPDQSKPTTTATTVYGVPLNRTSVTAVDIDGIHSKKTYTDSGPYEGYFHPFDGIVATSGLAVPLAYAMTGLAKMPSWAPMIIVSLLTRGAMSRRLAPNAPARPQGQGLAQGTGQ